MEYLRRKAKQVIQSRPQSDNLLHLQEVHRAQDVWNNEGDSEVMKCQRASGYKPYEKIDPKIKKYLRSSGFDSIASIPSIQVDRSLITALVERWRPETHTFHLTVGEVTITLQDVEVLTGLNVNGEAVTWDGCTDADWLSCCKELLGRDPGDALEVGKLSLSWLKENFSSLPNDAEENEIKCHARAQILRMLGGQMFANTSASYVHAMYLPLLKELEGEDGASKYAWGAAMLAHLYRELCKATSPNKKQISGPLQFLQIWAYERIPILRPELIGNIEPLPNRPLASRWKLPKTFKNVSNHNVREIRCTLDKQREDEIIWEPYRDVLHLLPHYCRQGESVWKSVVPIINMFIVEFHHPDRCLRQFGLNQPIPRDPTDKLDETHTMDLRGHHGENWAVKHKTFIEAWKKRHEMVADTVPIIGQLGSDSQYSQWYRQHTNRWITPEGAARTAVADGLEHMYHLPSPVEWESVRGMAKSMLYGLNEEHRMSTTFPPQPAPPPLSIPNISEPERDQRRRRKKNLAERRQKISFPEPPEGIQPIPYQRLCNIYSQNLPEENPQLVSQSSWQTTPQHVSLPIPQQSQPEGIVQDQFPSFTYDASSFHQSPQQFNPDNCNLNMQCEESHMGESSNVFTTPLPNIVPAFQNQNFNMTGEQENETGCSTMDPIQWLFDGGAPIRDGGFTQLLQGNLIYDMSDIQTPRTSQADLDLNLSSARRCETCGSQMNDADIVIENGKRIIKCRGCGTGGCLNPGFRTRR